MPSEVYSLTFDGPAPGSPKVFQSSRVAPPLASKAGYLGSLLRSSGRSYLDACKQRVLRPVSEVADIEARLEPAGRKVDPVFRHSLRHYVGFIRDFVKAGSAGLPKMLLTRWSLLICQGGLLLRGLLVMRVTTIDIFLRLPSGLLLTGEGLCHVEF